MSVSFTYGSYKFTISTPSAITCTEAGLNTYFKTAFVPTVKRNKSGTAITRYIHFELQSANLGHEIAIYKAVFTKTGTTATVTAHSSPNVRMGDIANDKLVDGMNRLQVMMSSSVSGNAEGTDIAMTINVNLYPTITLTPSKSQSTPAPGTFGYLKGICTASVTAAIKNTWNYTGGSVTVPISSSSISGNGRSASGTSQTSLTLSMGTMNSTSITVSASAKNSRGLTATATATITCSDYSPPEILSETAIRNSGDEENATITASYKLHSANQLGTTGAIKISYQIKNGSTTVKSGDGVICASGSALGSLTGSVTINITGDSLDVDTNYDVILTISDRAKTGNTKRDIITSTFRLIHVHPNGKGIGIFGAAPPSGLKIYGKLNGGELAFASYVYNGTSTSTITFQSNDLIGKSYIICGTQDSGNPVNRASLDPTTGTVTAYLSGAVTVMRLNVIAW